MFLIATSQRNLTGIRLGSGLFSDYACGLVNTNQGRMAKASFAYALLRKSGTSGECIIRLPYAIDYRCAARPL